MSQTVTRAVTILQLLAEESLRTTDIAQRLGVHDSTALRLLKTLEESRFVHRDDDGLYRLGSGIFYLSQRALERIDLRRLAQPHMRELGQLTGETVHLGVLEGKNVVYVEKVESTHPVRMMYSRIGRVAPLHCTGVAKAIVAFLPEQHRLSLCEETDLVVHTDNTHASVDSLLADLDDIRERDWASDREEHEMGIHCVAAPIWSAENRVVGSISLSAPTLRVAWDELEGFVPTVLETTRVISSQLGWKAPE